MQYIIKDVLVMNRIENLIEFSLPTHNFVITFLFISRYDIAIVCGGQRSIAFVICRLYQKRKKNEGYLWHTEGSIPLQFLISSDRS